MNRESFILVRIYGDSLSMPREFESVPFYCTYPELFRQSLEHIYPGKQVCLYNRSVGGGTIKSLWADYQRDSSYFRPDKGDVLIIQCGIVDCAPRPIPSSVGKFVSRLPGILQQVVRKFLHHYRPRILHSGFSWRHIIPQEFKSTLIKWLATAKEDFNRVYVFNIAPTNESIEAHSPGLSSSIELYNKLISKSIKSVESGNIHLMDIHKAIISSGSSISKYINDQDGHHITLEGHKLYARMIASHESDFFKDLQSA